MKRYILFTVAKEVELPNINPNTLPYTTVLDDAVAQANKEIYSALDDEWIVRYDGVDE